MDRGREHRDHREMRDRDRDRARDRPRDRDRDLDRRPRQRAYMDSYEHEPMAASAPPRCSCSRLYFGTELVELLVAGCFSIGCHNCCNVFIRRSMGG